MLQNLAFVEQVINEIIHQAGATNITRMIIKIQELL